MSTQRKRKSTSDGWRKLFFWPLLVGILLILAKIVVDRWISLDSDITFKVEVEDASSGSPISNANVRLAVSGDYVPLAEYTDSFGLVSFSIPEDVVGSEARLKVQKDGYPPWDEEVNLIDNALPYKVRLKPIE